MRKKRRDVAHAAWETFAKTGQVGSYLLYRAVRSVWRPRG